MKTIVQKLGLWGKRFLLAASLAFAGVGVANADTVSDYATIIGAYNTSSTAVEVIKNGVLNSSLGYDIDSKNTANATIDGNTYIKVNNTDTNIDYWGNGTWFQVNPYSWNGSVTRYLVVCARLTGGSLSDNAGFFLDVAGTNPRTSNVASDANLKRISSVASLSTTDDTWFVIDTEKSSNNYPRLAFYDPNQNVGIRYMFYAVSEPANLPSAGSSIDAPANVAATAASTTSITVTWTAVAGATNYKLYTSSNGGSSWDAGTTTGNVTSYTVTGLNSSTQYYFKLTATDGSATSDPSSSASATTNEAVPVLTITGSTNSSISLSWTYAGGGTPTYAIYRSTDGTNYSQLTTQTGTTYTDNAVSAGNTYYYKVAVQKSASEEFTVGGMTYTDSNSTDSFKQDQLQSDSLYNAGWIGNGAWAKYTINAAYTGTYDVSLWMGSDQSTVTAYLNDENNTTTPLVSVESESCTGGWQDYHEYTGTINLTAGNNGIYFVAGGGLNFWKMVFSIDVNTTGTASNVVSQEIAEAIAAPTNVSATATAYNSITVSWTASDNAVSYEVFRSGSENGTYTSIGTTNTTSLVDGGRSQNTT